MMAAPSEIPVSTPRGEIDAIAILLLVQVPPATESVSVTDEPAQMESEPGMLMALGPMTFMATVLVHVPTT